MLNLNKFLLKIYSFLDLAEFGKFLESKINEL